VRGVIEITDDELATEALAADPDPEVPDDAVPFAGPDVVSLLPEWYMPPAGTNRRTPRRAVVVVGLVASLVLVNAAGLCVTFGWPEIAW